MTEDVQAPGEATAPPTPFMLLCGSLGAQVHMALGLIPDPTTKKGEVEFDAARQGIEILEALEVKTAGNLEENEQKLLTDLLTQLKVLYVEVFKIHQKSGAEASTPGAEAPQTSQTSEEPDA